MGKTLNLPNPKVGVIAYLSAPEHLDTSILEKDAFLKLSEGSVTFNPFLARVGYDPMKGGSEYTLRVNIFGPLVFFLLVFHKGVLPGHASAAIRRFIKSMPGSVEISNKKRIITLKSGRLSWLDLYRPQILREKILNRKNY